MKSVTVSEKISRVSNAVAVDFANSLQCLLHICNFKPQVTFCNTHTWTGQPQALVQEVYVHQLVNVNEPIKALITEFVFTHSHTSNTSHHTPYDVEESLGLLQVDPTCSLPTSLGLSSHCWNREACSSRLDHWDRLALRQDSSSLA